MRKVAKLISQLGYAFLLLGVVGNAISFFAGRLHNLAESLFGSTVILIGAISTYWYMAHVEGQLDGARIKDDVLDEIVVKKKVGIKPFYRSLGLAMLITGFCLTAMGFITLLVGVRMANGQQHYGMFIVALTFLLIGLAPIVYWILSRKALKQGIVEESGTF
ncbi:MAG: hypothetical protein KDC12_00740 [Flavobacteriales bacterium]|nr:hypothetical protein [Flavobacteriales bacterium]